MGITPWLPAAQWHNGLSYFFNLIFNFLIIDLRERERKREEGKGRHRERNIDLLFHLFMHSLVISCMCPDGGLNPDPWCSRTTL